MGHRRPARTIRFVATPSGDRRDVLVDQRVGDDCCRRDRTGAPRRRRASAARHAERRHRGARGPAPARGLRSPRSRRAGRAASRTARRSRTRRGRGATGGVHQLCDHVPGDHQPAIRRGERIASRVVRPARVGWGRLRGAVSAGCRRRPRRDHEQADDHGHGREHTPDGHAADVHLGRCEQISATPKIAAWITDSETVLYPRRPPKRTRGPRPASGGTAPAPRSPRRPAASRSRTPSPPGARPRPRTGPARHRPDEGDRERHAREQRHDEHERQPAPTSAWRRV